jgi:hypothetical protein
MSFDNQFRNHKGSIRDSEDIKAAIFGCCHATNFRRKTNCDNGLEDRLAFRITCQRKPFFAFHLLSSRTTAKT